VLSSSVGPTKRRKVWIAGGASLLIVCLVAAAILLVSPKPAAMRITPPIATDPVSDAGKYDKHSDDFGVVPPPGNPEISPPPAPRPKTQKNPGVRIKESPGQERAEALTRDLERQQAELQLGKKRLADAQAALEAQQQEEARRVARVREELDRQKQLQRAEESPQPETKERSISSTMLPYQGPSSGTLVWEGEIAGAELVTIEGGTASSGKVTGMLPGVPCFVQSSDPKRVSVATAPGPSNQWKRIVLRIQSHGHTTVKVTWALP
jgi:hypothetical protein